jgi:hypothetical protein
MAKTIELNFGYAANATIPFVLYNGGVSATNLLNHYSAAFDAEGVSVIDISDLTGVSSGDTLLALGSTADGTDNDAHRTFSADVVVADSGVEPLTGFAPLQASYTNATFNDVTIPQNEEIEFSFTGMSLEVGGNCYVLSGPDGSYINFNLFNGRLSLRDETNSINARWDIPEALDGGEHVVVMKNNAQNTASELTLDGVTITPTTDNPRLAITFNKIGDSTPTGDNTNNGAIYNIKLGTQAAWEMLTANETDAYAVADSIGSNNLTFSGAPSPVTSTDVIQVGV